MPRNGQNNKKIVFVTGTDPTTVSGGIGFVMPAFLGGLDSVGFETRMIPTYKPDSFTGKWWPWMCGGVRLFASILRGKLSGKSMVVYSHPGAVLALFRESLLLGFCRVLGVPTLMHVHAPEVDSYSEKKVGRLFLRLVFWSAQQVCVMTPWWEQRLEEQLGKDAKVIPDPMPESLAGEAEKCLNKAKSSSNLEQSESLQICQILVVARLVEGKGIDKVIRSLPEMSNKVDLVIAGEGKQRRCLQSLVQELGLSDCVTFAGFVSGEEKYKLFKQSHIFCLPSRLDSFGMVFVEAMAYGLPVVALNYQSTPYVVPHDKAGILVDKDDPESLASALDHLAQDPELRAKLGKGGKQHVLEKFSQEVVGEKIRQVISDLIPK